MACNGCCMPQVCIKTIQESSSMHEIIESCDWMATGLTAYWRQGRLKYVIRGHVSRFQWSRGFHPIKRGFQEWFAGDSTWIGHVLDKKQERQSRVFIVYSRQRHRRFRRRENKHLGVKESQPSKYETLENNHVAKCSVWGMEWYGHIEDVQAAGTIRRRYTQQPSEKQCHCSNNAFFLYW
jgi:hypothetical protein